MKEYFKNILDSKSNVSSKRFISLYSLALFTVVVLSILFGGIVPDAVIYALVSLILGSSAMTLKTIKNNGKVEENNKIENIDINNN